MHDEKIMSLHSCACSAWCISLLVVICSCEVSFFWVWNLHCQDIFWLVLTISKACLMFVWISLHSLQVNCNLSLFLNYFIFNLILCMQCIQTNKQTDIQKYQWYKVWKKALTALPYSKERTVKTDLSVQTETHLSKNFDFGWQSELGLSVRAAPVWST